MGPETGDLQSASVMDVSRLQAAMQVVEQACSALQGQNDREAAEATLLAFRKSYRPIQSCQYILENSQMPNARFQAAAALQESAIREWGMFTADEKSNLRIYCLHYVMAKAGAPDAYVQVKVAAVAAALTKRGWLDMVATEKDAFFNEVSHAVCGAHGLAAQVAGISFLESLVSEFAPSTASAMRLSAEFHEHCRASMEADYLQKFYAWASSAANSVADKILQGSGSQLEVHVCASALRFMSQILSWEFQGTLVRGIGGAMVIGKSGANAFSMARDGSIGRRGGESGGFVQPGQAWQDSLLSPNHITWILQFYGHLRILTSDSGWIDSPLCVSARQLIVQLCFLSGDIFSSNMALTQDQHLQHLLSGIASWISPPDEVILAIKSGRSESEMLDGCRALGAIASLSSLSAFDDLLKPLGSTFGLLSSLTEAIIKASEERFDEEHTWAEEALESLLDTWTSLLQPADWSKMSPFPEGGMKAAAAVFHTYVQIELRAAAASANDDGDEMEQLQAVVAARDERLSSFALIARTAPGASLHLLGMLLSERCSALLECRGGRGSPISILEELHWIFLISGHVLADSGEGETPMVPEAVLTQIPAAVDPGRHPAVLLSWCAIALAQQSLDATLRAELFSSRLMEAIVWFFARWVDTYLMSTSTGQASATKSFGHEGNHYATLATEAPCDERNPVLNVFSEDGEGKSVLECLVHVAIVSLTAWPGETDLHEMACSQLLRALARRRNVCSHLVKLEGWQQLVKAFAFKDQSLLALSGPIQRGVSEALCRSAIGMGSQDDTNQFVKNLLDPLSTTLVDLSQRTDLSSFAQRPNTIFLVASCMERLRGAARATMPRSQKAIFEIGTKVMEPTLIFLETYRNESTVVYVLLKYTVDWIDGQVAFLEAKETAILFNFCARLLQIYSAHNIGKVPVSTSKSLLAESQAQKYKALRALLQLLISLSSKDLIDFASEASIEVENPDVSQMVYLGLHIITPLISMDLLKYPKLCRQYFTLLAHMLEVYPEKIAKLSEESFSQIVSTLEFGIRHQDVEVVNMSLTALNAVAFYHYQALCKGLEGLGSRATDSQTSNGDMQEGVLAHFLRSLMQYLLFEDYSNELIDAAADALLPLILCNPSLYQRLAKDFVKGQPNEVLQRRLATGFHMLINGNQVTSSLDRVNRRRFRENLYIFLAEVQNFLRTR